MNILLDTNVIIDYIAARQPWYREADQIWKRVRKGTDRGFVSASALTDIYYITCRILDQSLALKATILCYHSLTICTVDRTTVARALALPVNDFEDNIVIACAEQDDIDAIITRNNQDFQHTSITVYTPSEYLISIN